MDTTDMVKMQEQFAQHMSEFSARIVSVWSDAAKKIESSSGVPRTRKADTPWPDLSVFARTFGVPPTAEKLQEAVRQAAEDLPALARCIGDPEKIEPIKDKWARLYEKSARAFLGVPEPSDTARILDQWRWILGNLPSHGAKISPTPFPSLMSLIYPLEWPVASRQGRLGESRGSWLETWGQNLGSMFPILSGEMDSDRNARLRQAVEAEIRFLQSIPEFQAHLISASKRAVEAIFARLGELGFQEMSAQNQGLFFASWVSANEKMFRELFGSETFLQTLTRTVQQGLNARNMMQSVFADWPAARDRANQQDVGDLHEKLYSVEKRVRLLERELDDLKRKLAESPSSRNSNDGA